MSETSKTSSAPQANTLQAAAKSPMSVPTSEVTSGTSTVTVVCKLPGGVVLETYGASGAADAKVVLNGARADVRFRSNVNALLGLYGKTQVSKDFWAKWMATVGKTSRLVAQGVVFAENTEASADSKAKELAAETTGLEGADASKAQGIQKEGESAPK